MKIVGIYAVIDKNFYVIRNIEILVNDIRRYKKVLWHCMQQKYFGFSQINICVLDILKQRFSEQ